MVNGITRFVRERVDFVRVNYARLLKNRARSIFDLVILNLCTGYGDRISRPIGVSGLIIGLFALLFWLFDGIVKNVNGKSTTASRPSQALDIPISSPIWQQGTCPMFWWLYRVGLGCFDDGAYHLRCHLSGLTLEG